ncbi:GIY-YIG nuclease family protein [Altererythrobacter sp. MTPC7]|uniref:GIY-YIG nuclease family protein n=1 Tax=Altererythrobacter sp. MTPC7 TaxID=3056567 RepID=UPI0036F24AEA
MAEKPKFGESLNFRAKALSELTNAIGVYALCDLDHVPIYIGQSTDGIRSRVQRHLTSARSDVIANRQIDVWEIASVKAWPVDAVEQINTLENGLFNHFHVQSPLMNGAVLASSVGFQFAECEETVMVLSEQEIARRKEPEARLPRQIQHYLRLVDHFLNVKSSKEMAVALDVHFARLKKYHEQFLDTV